MIDYIKSIFDAFTLLRILLDFTFLERNSLYSQKAYLILTNDSLAPVAMCAFKHIISQF